MKSEDNTLVMDRTMAAPGGGRREDGLTPGDVLGQYRIVRSLGRGGMGEAYEAEHQVLRRRYALKLLHRGVEGQGVSLERFQLEAQVMANLEHPNIIRVDDFGETAGRFWLRMELAEGLQAETTDCQPISLISLKELADAHQGRLPQDLLLTILRQVLAGLDYAHHHGAVHRDIKPANILFQRSVVKIADFGLVKLVGEEWVRSQAEISVHTSLSLGEKPTMKGTAGGDDEGTSTRALLGTYEYMSPEQKLGGAADARSDLYAVGVMAYRLLTGRNIGPKAPSRIDPSLAPAWDDFVEQALEENPEERLTTAAAALRLLDAVEVRIGNNVNRGMHVSSKVTEARHAPERSQCETGQQIPLRKPGDIPDARVHEKPRSAKASDVLNSMQRSGVIKDATQESFVPEPSAALVLFLSIFVWSVFGVVVVVARVELKVVSVFAAPLITGAILRQAWKKKRGIS